MVGSEIPFAGWGAGICTANGIDLHYLRSGGDFPPLVALHGLLGSGACLVPLARTLRDGFDVILPDARGHGKSDAPAEGYRYRDLADDVVGLIGQLNLQAPILLGHSMGGMTAAVVAGRSGVTISGLVLVEPTFINPEWQRKIFESDIVEEQRRSLASSRSDLLARARLRNPRRPREISECLVDARRQTSLSAFDVLTPPNPDHQELVRDIGVPTLLVTGGAGIVPPDAARDLQKLNPLLRHELIEGGGHGLPYDLPERLGAAILSFLRSSPASVTGSSRTARP